MIKATIGVLTSSAFVLICAPNVMSTSTTSLLFSFCPPLDINSIRFTRDDEACATRSPHFGSSSRISNGNKDKARRLFSALQRQRASSSLLFMVPPSMGGSSSNNFSPSDLRGPAYPYSQRLKEEREKREKQNDEEKPIKNDNDGDRLKDEISTGNSAAEAVDRTTKLQGRAYAYSQKLKQMRQQQKQRSQSGEGTVVEQAKGVKSSGQGSVTQGIESAAPTPSPPITGITNVRSQLMSSSNLQGAAYAYSQRLKKQREQKQQEGIGGLEPKNSPQVKSPIEPQTSASTTTNANSQNIKSQVMSASNLQGAAYAYSQRLKQQREEQKQRDVGEPERTTNSPQEIITNPTEPIISTNNSNTNNNNSQNIKSQVMSASNLQGAAYAYSQRLKKQREEQQRQRNQVMEDSIDSETNETFRSTDAQKDITFDGDNRSTNSTGSENTNVNIRSQLMSSDNLQGPAYAYSQRMKKNASSNSNKGEQESQNDSTSDNTPSSPADNGDVNLRTQLMSSQNL